MKKTIRFIIWIGLVISLGLSLIRFSREFPKQYGYIQAMTLDDPDHVAVNFYKDNKEYVAKLDSELLVSRLYVRHCKVKDRTENIRAICEDNHFVYLLIDSHNTMDESVKQYLSVIDMNKFWFNKETRLIELDDDYSYDTMSTEEKNGEQFLNVLGMHREEGSFKWQFVNKSYQIQEDHTLKENTITQYEGIEDKYIYKLFCTSGRLGCLSSQGKLYLSDEQGKLQTFQVQDVDKKNNGILKVIVDSKGELYTLEHRTGILRHVTLEDKMSELIALGEDYVGAGTGIQYNELYNLVVESENNLIGVTEEGDKDKLIWLKGSEVKQQDGFYMTFENKMNYLIQYFTQIYLLFILVASLVMVIILGIKNCKYLAIKIVIIGGLLGSFLIFGMGQIIKENYGMILENDVKDTLEQYYNYYLQYFKEYDLKAVLDGKDKELEEVLFLSFEEQGLEDVLAFYDGELKVGIYGSNPKGYLLDYYITEEEAKHYLEQVNRQTPTYIKTQDRQSSYYSLYGVINEVDGCTAILKLNYNKRYINSLRDRLNMRVNLGMIAFGVIFLVAFMISLKVLLRPIAEVEKGLECLSIEQTGQKLKYYSKDEVYRISKMINALSEKLEHQQYRLDKNSENYFRFLSKGLFEIFHKKNNSDLAKGDTSHLESCMALISLEWQKDSEKESYIEANNKLLEMIEESVKESKTIVSVDNKDLTDMNIILLEDETESFLRAMKLAAQLSSSRLWKNNCIILDYLETEHALIGNDEKWLHRIYSSRKDFLQKQIQMLRKSNCQLILTKEMLSKVKNVGVFNYRFIGFIEEGALAIKLYDFYEQAPVEIKEAKQRNHDLFAKALETFYAEDFYEARNLFARVIRDDPADEVARWYIFRCDYIEKAGMDNKGLSLVMM